MSVNVTKPRELKSRSRVYSEAYDRASLVTYLSHLIFVLSLIFAGKLYSFLSLILGSLGT